MPDWKKVKFDFSTVKLGQFIEPVKDTICEDTIKDFRTVYGVTNTEGITITGKITSKDISKYILIDSACFVYNPYRINVGSIGFNSTGLKGCVSPAYVVFKVKHGLSPEFLFFYLKSEIGNHLINWYGNHGGVRNSLSYDDLCLIDIPNINYETQLYLLENINKTKSELDILNVDINNQLNLLNLLRQSILQDAIEGKLTAKWRKENPELISGENHASRLLEKVKAEKERLVKDGKIRKEKPFALISDEEKPFDLPDGWVWCRLPQIMDYGDSLRRGPFGSSITKSMFVQESQHSTKIYEQKNAIYKNFTIGNYFINLDEHPNLKSFIAGPGDIIISCAGTIGETYLLPINAPIGIINQALLKIRLNQQVINNQYFIIAFKASTKSTINEDAKGTAMKNISSIQYLKNKLLFPLPSLLEQKIIIEQVNKYTVILNELEKQVIERKELSGKLLQAVLREAFATN